MKARLLQWFALLFGIVWLGAGVAHAQEEAVRTIPFEGPEVFAHVLHGEGIKPIASYDEAFREPDKCVIILFGSPSILEKHQKAAKGLSAFRYKGGNVLVATDYRADLYELSVRIAGVPISQREGAYRKTPDCPWLGFEVGKGFPTEDAAGHPLFQSLQRGIATNRPSRLSQAPIVPMKSVKGGPQLQTVLVIPHAVNAETQTRFLGAAPDYMAASRSTKASHGRMLVVAGHGMFMNGMMLQDDNDNYAFARNAVRWLCAGKDGKTSRRALFLYDGRVIADFNMNLNPPPPPIPVPTMQMLNRLVRGLEEERFFHRVLEELLGPQILRNVVLALLGLVSFGLMVYGTKKLRAARAHIDTAAPSMVGSTPALRAPDPLQQRQQALLRQADFWQQAHDLALAWFRSEFDVTPDQWHVNVKASFQAEGSLLARWRLQRQADWALRLARAGGPMRVSRHQFFALIDSLKELSLASKNGRLALLVDGKNVRQT